MQKRPPLGRYQGVRCHECEGSRAKRRFRYMSNVTKRPLTKKYTGNMISTRNSQMAKTANSEAILSIIKNIGSSLEGLCHVFTKVGI